MAYFNRKLVAVIINDLEQWIYLLEDIIPQGKLKQRPTQQSCARFARPSG